MRARGPRYGAKRRPALLLGLAAVILILAGLYWGWAAAQLRAAVVLSSVVDVPVMTRAGEALTGEPRVAEEIVAGVPATVARPRGEGPWPALIFVNGATPHGRDEPAVQRLAEGLARSGYVVYVPDLPGTRTGEISDRTVSSLIEVIAKTAASPDTLGGRVSLAGVSVGASLSLLAAADPAADEDVAAVSGVAPYADLKEVARLATIGTYHDGEETIEYETPQYLRLVIARSIIASLPNDEDRELLLSVLPDIEHYSLADESAPDPLAALPALGIIHRDRLAPGTLRVIELLSNEEPESFERLYARLPPQTHGYLERSSPLESATELDAPVELASAPRDRYFPVAESRELASEAPRAELTVTPALSHAHPEPSVEDLPAFLRLNGFFVRSLHAADEPET